MTRIPRTIKIDSVSGNGVVLFGNTLVISPTSVSKSVTGAGSSLTGDFPSTYTFLSIVLVDKLKTRR
jgi:hypothetical protein